MKSPVHNARKARETSVTMPGRLERLATKLAQSQRISPRRRGRARLRGHLQELETVLRDGYQRFASEGQLARSYAAEWLLDNFYVVQQAQRDLRNDMPDSYYRQLPQLEDVSSAGCPRIHRLARAVAEASDSRLDLPRLTRFLRAYQRVAPLTIGELWALPSMLRLAILENLAELVSRIVPGNAPDEAGDVVPSAEGLVAEAQVASCIVSLRMLAAQDWPAFVEKSSRVEQVLRTDAAGVYRRNDFDTRDRCRKVVERLARATGRSEEEVAQEAVRLATEAKERDGQPVRTHHVGFYLLDAGRTQLEKRLGYRPPWYIQPRRWLLRHPTPIYLAGISLLSSLFVLAGVLYAVSSGGSALAAVVTALLLVLPAMMVGISLTNWIITHSTPPRVLAKLDFQKGVPADCRTMVVIPSLLESSHDVDSLLQQLERHFLSNRDRHLCFALLTDFTDAPREHMPGDEALIERATAGIEALNQRYGRLDSEGPFYLFQRARKWNSAEECWMGWERKRGKLLELNRLLRGGTGTSHVVKLGKLDVLPQIRYVITLDADTILPRDSARRLIGTLAHPLNRAEFDPQSGEVDAGYTILQPRVEVSPTSANRSRFTRIFSGDAGVDLYTRAVSDVYQDLFGEGIYVGKGIYDVDAFERSVAGRMPENSLLSHDLLEGAHGRVALLTDVTLFEDYPPQYLPYAHRSHRWIRGDWQLLPWLMPVVPQADGRGVRNYLSALDRWQILDNLRRSLRSPALLALWVVGWLWLPGSPLVWTLAAAAAPATDLITSTVTGLARGPRLGTATRMSHGAWQDVLRWLVQLALLPYSALLTVDAIASTLVRVTISHRHLLQWTTAAHTIYLFGRETKVGITWRRMGGASVLAGAVSLLVGVFDPAVLPVAAPLLVAWLLSPQVAYWISAPVARKEAVVSATDRERLRRLARRTWLYFEEFVGPDDNWLPPDHYQEEPRGVVAHRTSPTNVGLLLLCTLASYDLGYTDQMELAMRLRYTFDSMDRLERYRGHFLNWYDTRSLRPLLPRYVSTVDSGNLAACLLALQQGLAPLAGRPVFRWQGWQGLLDTLAILEEAIGGLEGPAGETIAECRTHVREIREQVLAVEHDPEAWARLLERLCDEEWERLVRLLRAAVESQRGTGDAATLAALRISAGRVRSHIFGARRKWRAVVPWAVALLRPPGLLSRPDVSQALTDAWQALVKALPGNPRLSEIPGICEAVRGLLGQVQELLTDGAGSEEDLAEARQWCADLAEQIDAAREEAQKLLDDFREVSERAEAYFQEMQFGFLFNPQRQMFHIGYNVTSGRLDANYYDLVASEARIASLVAIAKGEVPQTHWIHLGRPFALVDGARALLSWSGSMFEYLMPTLLMRSYEGTFLAQSCRAAVDHQIAYGRQKHVPWGISEAAYYAFDGDMNYQYGPFGVPGLGLKRGLGEDLVVAPYASLLALSLRPQAVVENVARFTRLGALGLYGLDESIDYTPSRLPAEQTRAIVHAYYAHHHGMSLLALTNYLHGDTMVRRFHADGRVQSVELLLQEQTPRQVAVEARPLEEVRPVQPAAAPITYRPWRVPVGGPIPQVHLLSNGRYSAVVDSAGGGYSCWEKVDLTRWRADGTLNDWGTWLYVRDADSGAVWSVGRQPTATAGEEEEVLFHTYKAEFRRRDHGVSVRMEVTVPPDDDVEIRRITLTNHSERVRRLALTSYGEVVLAPQVVDRRHPAFNKLFVESEYLVESRALLFRRRPRSADEEPVYMAHLVVTERGRETPPTYESDRFRFLGRGRTVRSPDALTGQGQGLSGATGATLDPIMALGQEIELRPYATARLAYVTLAAGSRSQAVDLAARYQEWSRVDWGFDQARSRAELGLRELEVTGREVERVERLVSALVYPHKSLRARAATLAANRKGQAGLWPFAISGDYPILLVRVGSEGALALVNETLRAHTYWRSRQVKIDLVILNEEEDGYDQPLSRQVQSLVGRNGGDAWLNERGGIFLLSLDQMGPDDQVLLETAARVILDGEKGSLGEQLSRVPGEPMRLPPLPITLRAVEDVEPTRPLERPGNLLFDNGLGGFTPDGREYVIYLEPGQCTPAPWVNAVANREFGFLISESGSGYTWFENSGENRLTPWRNDPVSDAPGEALYLRDEETGQVWSPTPLPARADAPYLIRHGAGYSTFEHYSHGLQQRLRVFAVPDAAVKVVQLRLENTWRRVRRITATFYAEWVLGSSREETRQYVVPAFDGGCQALLVRNSYSEDWGERVAFVAASKRLHGLTADRTEFLGRHGTLSHPAALDRVGLASALEAGLDPCAAVQVHFDLRPGEAGEVCFLLGQGEDEEQARSLVTQYQDTAQVEAAWTAMTRHWDSLLGAATIRTPDPAMDLLFNRWLLYQTLSCRLWARAALYQSSGAFGFRDQLQDVMALVLAASHLARQHILEAARHQFEEGDVLHWWHPPSGRGVRTRFSDDLLWLPFVTAHYVSATGDTSILTETVPFLQGEPLGPEELDRYGRYESAAEVYSLYEHCRRALEKGTTAGSHGLPLIGTGDWNDGLDRVGVGGKGESVWLGWFVYATLQRFAPLCELAGDGEQAARYRERAAKLRQALESSAWDGTWYRRAWYDDGTPLGSAQDDEYQIGSLPQSWAILSGGADPDRAVQAMEAVIERLVRHDDGLLLLFAPPFDQTPRDPGYIKGYPPGVRENGGQYTHAALWAVWAFAQLGQGDRAMELLRMLNPISHSSTPGEVTRYRVEPYVVAADLYSAAPYVGRGGWTWHTGSASWMYRVVLEAILGLSRTGHVLRINPCIPREWPGYEVAYRDGETTYHIRVENPLGVSRGVQRITLDGEPLPGSEIQLVRDGKSHVVGVEMG